MTIAEANSVDIAVVVNERDEFMSAARIARTMVMSERQQEQQTS